MGVYALLNQDQVWVDVQGNAHRVDEMSVRYKGNVVRFIERRAARIGWAYSTEEIQAIYAPIGREVIGVVDGEDVLGDLMYGGPRGEMACDAVEAALDEGHRQQLSDPVGWVRDTKIMRRLLADVAANRGGEDG